jgi:DeoR family transcriptional regulator of aga operon
MLKPQRLQAIYKIVKANGQASVSLLADQIGVSEMTIRRDLEELQAEGLVNRIHGGAVSVESQQWLTPELPVVIRREEQAAEKRQIARAVADMIERDETIFLGSGTTTLAIAEVLAERNEPLTVITNALTIANTLAKASQVGVVVIGGYLRRSELSLVGHITEQLLGQLRLSKAFIGIRGLDPEYGLTSDHFQELKTDQTIIQMSDTLILVADHTKFGRVAVNQMAPIDVVSMIITSSKVPASMVEAIEAKGIEVLQVTIEDAAGG